jgi:hypothetical protein
MRSGLGIVGVGYVSGFPWITGRQETDYADRLLEIMRESQEQFVAADQARLGEMAAAMERYPAE